MTMPKHRLGQGLFMLLMRCTTLYHQYMNNQKFMQITLFNHPEVNIE